MRAPLMAFLIPTVKFVTTISLAALIGMQPVDASSKEQERAEIDKLTAEILTELYKTAPEAKKAVAEAYGYAAFSNFGMKIMFLGGGKGKGVAINNKTKQKIYMKMLEGQAGLGMGIKKFRLVFIFENKQVFDQFITEGWQASGQATAAAKTEQEGQALAGALSVTPGVWLYQMTEKGLALEVTAKGTKYYKDDDLN